MNYYGESDYHHNSPKLEAFKPRATPTPSPPPFIPRQIRTPSPKDSPRPGRKDRSRRRKTKASQGDAVLIGQLAPNYPEIAREAGRVPLNSASQSEASDVEDMSMEEQNNIRTSPEQWAQNGNSMDAGSSPRTTAAARSESIYGGRGHSSGRKDSQVTSTEDRPYVNINTGTDPMLDTRSVFADTNLGKPRVNDAIDSDDTSPTSHQSSPKSPPNGTNPSSGFQVPANLSTRIAGLQIPQSRDHGFGPANALSPIGSAASPEQSNLPNGGVKMLLAETAASSQETTTRANGIPHHRASYSGSSAPPAHSPTLSTRHYSIGSQQSPSGQLSAFSHRSPTSAHSDLSPQDPFLKSTAIRTHDSMLHRRQSQASESVTSPYASTLRSGSSSEGFSPSAQISPSDSSQRLSIDSAMRSDANGRPTLPLPPNLPPVPIASAGGYKCEHPGCTAPPFSTQYLLK
jgi:hypothetical protein